VKWYGNELVGVDRAAAMGGLDRIGPNEYGKAVNPGPCAANKIMCHYTNLPASGDSYAPAAGEIGGSVRQSDR
jgi:hypothetical protein